MTIVTDRRTLLGGAMAAGAAGLAPAAAAPETEGPAARAGLIPPG